MNQINLYKKWKLEDILILMNTKGIGDLTIKSILTHTDSLYSFQNTSNNKLKTYSKLLSNQEIFFDSREGIIEKQIEAFHKYEMKLVGFWDSDYPVNLSHDGYAPPVLFYKGDITFLNKNKCISIVGTRRNTSYGREVAEKFATTFAQNDIAVISGMAQGIDTISHKATIDAKGKTLAVLASGLDQIQPSYATDFAEKIVDSGSAIITAYPPNKKALNQFFVQRNRIISGLSLATIVIESKEKGGSLWTAKFANEQNREVFAVPGKINSDRSIGTHYLIHKQIAQIAISPEQVMTDLGIGASNIPISKSDEKYNKLSSIEKSIYDILEADAKNIDRILDEINNFTEIDISQLQSQLLIMEFNGIIKQSSGNSYSII